MANEAGQRVQCKKCSGEVVVIKGGDGVVKCCGLKMEPKS